MQLKFVSINDDDQPKGLDLYTKAFVSTKMTNFTVGDYRWLTVVSPDGIKGVERILESVAFPFAKERV